MLEVGFALSSEEFSGSELVHQAVMAEEAGFTFAGISDHYHPWIDRQGHSPFVWSVLGGIATATERLRVGTMVTCPTIRTHPAIIAQAAATVAEMMPGRFFLGVGTGENLNEHIVGRGWPRAGIRREMLEEAIGMIRRLWQGGYVNHDGLYYTLENARIYTLPPETPPIYVAAAASEAASLAGRVGDGLVATSPDSALVERFQAEGNTGPRLGQLAVCIQESEEAGVRIATEVWPVSVLSGAFKQELPLPAHFEELVGMATPDAVAKAVLCTHDPQQHIEALQAYEDAGYTHVYVHQIGPNQERFARFYMEEVIPAIGTRDRAA